MLLEKSCIKIPHSRRCCSFSFEVSRDSITVTPLEQDPLLWPRHTTLPFARSSSPSQVATTSCSGYQQASTDIPDRLAPETFLGQVDQAHHGGQATIIHVSPKDYGLKKLESWRRWDAKGRDARASRNESFDGLFYPRDHSRVLGQPQRSPPWTHQGIVANSELSGPLSKFLQCANSLPREMANQSDSLQKTAQPQASPFCEIRRAFIHSKHAAPSPAVIIVPPPPSSRTRLHRPLRKSPADSHLFSRYAAGAIMGQPSWREKYEIRDLLIPHRNHDQPDPFGTPLSKSAIKTLQQTLERVCGSNLNVLIRRYFPNSGFHTEVKNHGTARLASFRRGGQDYSKWKHTLRAEVGLFMTNCNRLLCQTTPSVLARAMKLLGTVVSTKQYVGIRRISRLSFADCRIGFKDRVGQIP